MTLDAATYFGHLRAYVNDRYVTDDGSAGEVVLREKYFPPTGTRARTRKIRLLLPGPAHCGSATQARDRLSSSFGVPQDHPADQDAQSWRGGIVH